MRQIGILEKALLILVASCGSAAQSQGRPRFALCDPQGNRTTFLDFDTKWALVEDMAAVVQPCPSARACMTFPIIMSEPPRWPRTARETVTWSAEEYRMSMRSGQRAGTYVIDVRAAPSTRGVRPRYTYHYDRVEGLMRIRPGGSGADLLRCAGRLTFSDLESLTSRDARPAARPPAWH